MEEKVIEAVVNSNDPHSKQITDAAQQIKESIDTVCTLWGCPKHHVNARLLGVVTKTDNPNPTIISYVLEQVEQK